jgi:hypothetical protein
MRFRNGRLEVVEQEAARHGQPQRRQRPPGQVDPAVRKHFVQQHRVAHRMRDCTHGVERRRERNRAVGGCQARRVLEADQAVQGGGNADRTAGVRTERCEGRTRRHADRSAGR